MRKAAFVFAVMLAISLLSCALAPLSLSKESRNTAANLSVLASDTYRIAATWGDVPCGATAADDWSYQNARMVEVNVGQKTLGGADDYLPGDYNLTRILIDPVGAASVAAQLNLSGVRSNSTNSLPQGYLFNVGSGTFAHGGTGIENAPANFTIVSQNGFFVGITNGNSTSGWMMMPSNVLAKRALDGTQLPTIPTGYFEPKVLFKAPGRECWNWAKGEHGGIGFDAIGNAGYHGYVMYARYEPETYDHGVCGMPGLPSATGYVLFHELLGNDYWTGAETAIPVYVNATQMSFMTGTQGSIYYKNGIYCPAINNQTATAHAVPPSFQTQRGLSFTSIEQGSVQFYIPDANGTLALKLPVKIQPSPISKAK